MNQTVLFHEDIYSAYRTDVQASGGFKVIGHKLRPTLKPDKAGEWLSQCLTADRPEKLSLEDQLFIKREARRSSSFAALTFEMQELCMTMPLPVEPEDKRAQLQREFISAVGVLKNIETQLGKLQ